MKRLMKYYYVRGILKKIMEKILNVVMKNANGKVIVIIHKLNIDLILERIIVKKKIKNFNFLVIRCFKINTKI